MFYTNLNILYSIYEKDQITTDKITKIKIMDCQFNVCNFEIEDISFTVDHLLSLSSPELKDYDPNYIHKGI